MQSNAQVSQVCAPPPQVDELYGGGSRVTGTAGGGILGVDWSRNRRYVATGHNGPHFEVRVWNAEVAPTVTNLMPILSSHKGPASYESEAAVGVRATWVHTNDVTDVKFSPDSAYIASVSLDGSVKKWPVSMDFSTPPVSSNMGMPFRTVSWKPDGTQLAAGTTNGLIIVFGATNLAMTGNMAAHLGGVLSVAYSPHDKPLLASAGEDGRVKLFWDPDGASSWQLMADGYEHSDIVTSLSWSPDGSRLLSGSRDRSLIVWSVDWNGQGFCTLSV